MAYYNYHAMAKRLIESGHTIGASVFRCYHHIYPALVIYFDNHKPIPIREYMWEDYLPLLKKYKINILNDENLPLE